ncbi:hypothetical protein [Amnibacterium endophyticum]|uniref:Uncharacterized protein n=1 Tax=Amnibacterium endophyticum TaxID=2109337 RepID=A0ABW4LGH4_9MICO
MGHLKDVHCYPYSGWFDIPWGLPKPLEQDPTTDELDIDAAARSSRRVTEAISAEISSSNLPAPRSSHRIMLDVYDGPDISVTAFDQRTYDFGRLQIPRGFRHFNPDTRAELLADAVTQHLSDLATLRDWDHSVLSAAVRRARDSGWAATFVGSWKRTPDRHSRVRLFGQIHDDGYARWRIGVSDLHTETHLTESDEARGWTWLKNLKRSAAGARFLDDHRLEVPSGSMFLTETQVVDIRSGTVTADYEVPPLSYPGDATLEPPRPAIHSTIE